MNKKCFFLLSVLLCIYLHVSAKENDSSTAHKKIFVRLYDSRLNKIGKGYLLPGSDSSRIFLKRHKEISFPVQEVAAIKTRHSAWNPVLTGTAIGVGTAIILAAASGASDNNGNSEAGFDLALAAAAAPVAGLIGGSIATAFRKRETFPIDGSIEKWMELRSILLGINR